MYNYNLSVKKLRETHRTFSKINAQQRWLKNYHQQVQPKLLEHYDARVNAFIKKVEQKPQKVKEVEHKTEQKQPPWNFALSSRSHRSYTDSKFRIKTAPNQQPQSIWRSSSYIPTGPLGQHQFRQRNKTKQLKPKKTLNELLYKKYKEVRKIRFKTNNEKSVNKMPEAISVRKPNEDNRSEGPSVYEDNVSMRYSVNSEMENIEKDALEYEKNQEIIERKDHYKRLASLEVAVNDKRAKNSLHHLLVKEGKKKQKKRAEGEEVETDLLKALFSNLKQDSL